MSQGLVDLADAFGVATHYWDWQGQHQQVSEATLTAVLAALGVDTTDPEAALIHHRLQRWRRMLPPVKVVRQGQQATVDVHVPHGSPVEIWLDLEDGAQRRDLAQQTNDTPAQDVDGHLVGEATFAVPSDLPLGYHVLRARSGEHDAAMAWVVTPAWLGLPADMSPAHGWGLATQLYSVRSRDSWGVGDLGDLTDLAVWSAVEHQAAYVLVNPMHAVQPVPPMEPSPYLPTTRRFANPLYLRVEAMEEYAGLSGRDRTRVANLRRKVKAALDSVDRIDRQTAWEAKRIALRLIAAVPRRAGREFAYQAFCDQGGVMLQRYATWCALAEEHGADWWAWPPELQDPTSPAVAEYADRHPDVVDFHRWMAWQLDEQLAMTHDSARRAGMSLGIMHDLAVGVNRRGAETWSMPEVFAQGISVGAPPDAYTQLGQDWGQPPWRPDALEALEYQPFRSLVATVLKHAGGVRVDHVLGLFRLWWIPDGAAATEGTFVRYDHDAMVGILALEAHRAGAVVVGEDVGTVEPWVRDYLRERGILGTSILFFERDYAGDGSALPPERWREWALASVTTHDLPPTLGYLAGDHVRLRDRLGMLTRPLAEELAIDSASREDWLNLLLERGLTAPDASAEEVLIGLHRLLSQSPARLQCVALVDAVGDRRTQNQPGTVDEYPNWRVPLTDSDGRLLTLEDVFESPRVREVLAAIGH